VDIKKTIITVAGRHQRTLPLQTLVDRDGVQKAALRILIEEALAAGIEEVCLVVHPGDQAAFRTAADPMPPGCNSSNKAGRLVTGMRWPAPPPLPGATRSC